MCCVFQFIASVGCSIFIIFVTMKFSEKYSQLNNPASLQEIVSSSVYATMALENQTVRMSYILKTVKRLLKVRKSK